MNDQYFNMKSINTFNASFFFMLKLRLFGKKITERDGFIEAVWYAYKGRLYLVQYSAF